MASLISGFPKAAGPVSAHLGHLEWFDISQKADVPLLAGIAQEEADLE